MCDEFVCSDSGVGLCDDDRKLLENLGFRKQKPCEKIDNDKKVNEDSVTDNNNNGDVENKNLEADGGSMSRVGNQDFWKASNLRICYRGGWYLFSSFRAKQHSGYNPLDCVI